MTQTTNPAICSTILAQIGGNRALTMLGAKNLVDLGNGVSMKIGRNAKKVTHVAIVLADDDTYTVTFTNVRNYGLDIRRIAAADMIYADNLAAVIESNTGMYLSL